MNQLRHMSIFAHIVETGSISAAAAHLNVSKSVISQHLKNLEQELAITLLKRTTRRQTLTVAGKQFYEHCRSLNNIADLAWQDAQETLKVPRGHIRITAPNALIETLITPVISDLLKQYPLLEPELIASDDRLNISECDIDLAIRVGQLPNSNLVQKYLGSFKDVLCAHSEQQGDVNIEDLPYIANAWQGKQIQHQFSSPHLADIHYRTQARCITNSFHSCLSLIRSGAGIGIIPDFYFHNIEPSLQQVFPEHQLSTNRVYALTPFGKNNPISVNICIAAIAKQFKAI